MRPLLDWQVKAIGMAGRGMSQRKIAAALGKSKFSITYLLSVNLRNADTARHRQRYWEKKRERGPGTPSSLLRNGL